MTQAAASSRANAARVLALNHDTYICILAALSVIAAELATRRWIDRFVIGERLCPWAPPADVRIVVSDRLSVDGLVEEASRLRAAESSLSTTLVVYLDDAAQDDAAVFARFSTAAQPQLGSGIDLLAFHPSRHDSGPGCSEDLDDAGHFSVRSPLPTCQLLRSFELQNARARYSAGLVAGSRAALARHPGSPGALSLLLENKRRLRALGSSALQALLSGCLEGRT